MELPGDEIAEVTAVFENVQRAVEAGVTYFLIPQARLPAGCSPERVDLLFCPAARDGYSSRLFFANRVQGQKSLNWNAEVRILERNWHAHSWNPGNQRRLMQILAAHLEALR